MTRANFTAEQRIQVLKLADLREVLSDKGLAKLFGRTPRSINCLIVRMRRARRETGEIRERPDPEAVEILHHLVTGD